MRAGKPLGVLGATVVAGAGTAANRLAGVPLSSLAATPRAVGEGKLWLIVTSGLLADTPWLPSLLGFAIVLTVALYVLRVRQVVAAAVAGQILSALLVYGIVGGARLLYPHAFGSVVDLQDYGVSAMIAAWIGAVACVAWTRHSHLRVVAGCLVCLAVGLAFRPTLTFLDSEHVVAFAIGIAVVRGQFGRIARADPEGGRSRRRRAPLLNLADLSRLAAQLDGVSESRREGLLNWRYRGRLVARQLDESHIVIRASFEFRDFLLQSFPETFSVPTRFAKHMMVVADLEHGDADAMEDAVIGAWELQSGTVARP